MRGFEKYIGSAKLVLLGAFPPLLAISLFIRYIYNNRVASFDTCYFTIVSYFVISAILMCFVTFSRIDVLYLYFLRRCRKLSRWNLVFFLLYIYIGYSVALVLVAIVVFADFRAPIREFLDGGSIRNILAPFGMIPFSVMWACVAASNLLAVRRNIRMSKKDSAFSDDFCHGLRPNPRHAREG